MSCVVEIVFVYWHMEIHWSSDAIFLWMAIASDGVTGYRKKASLLRNKERAKVLDQIVANVSIVITYYGNLCETTVQFQVRWLYVQSSLVLRSDFSCNVVSWTICMCDCALCVMFQIRELNVITIPIFNFPSWSRYWYCSSLDVLAHDEFPNTTTEKCFVSSWSYWLSCCTCLPNE